MFSQETSCFSSSFSHLNLSHFINWKLRGYICGYINAGQYGLCWPLKNQSDCAIAGLNSRIFKNHMIISNIDTNITISLQTGLFLFKNWLVLVFLNKSCIERSSLNTWLFASSKYFSTIDQKPCVNQDKNFQLMQAPSNKKPVFNKKFPSRFQCKAR